MDYQLNRCSILQIALLVSESTTLLLPTFSHILILLHKNLEGLAIVSFHGDLGEVQASVFSAPSGGGTIVFESRCEGQLRECVQLSAQVLVVGLSMLSLPRSVSPVPSLHG